MIQVGCKGLYFDNESILREFFSIICRISCASSMNTYCEYPQRFNESNKENYSRTIKWIMELWQEN